MNGGIKIKSDKNLLLEYIKDFQEGKIQVPAFQRDFVWNNNQKLELLESIEKGYPIGSILLWRPDFKKEEDFYKFESESIGSYKIPNREEDYFYILDGFQRLSTLFGCLVNPHKTKLERNIDEWESMFNIIYNLEAEEGEYSFELSRKTSDLEYYKIPVYKLIDPKEFFDFQRTIFHKNLHEEKIEEYLSKFENISKRFQTFELPSINIYGGTISEAVDIFQRLNSRGSKISSDWIVSALSFNKDRDFKLGKEIDQLLEDVSIYNFSNQKREVILQCITNSFDKIHFDKASKGKKLEELARRPDFIDKSRSTLDSIQKAIKFLFEELLVLDSKLLPYSNHLIFITDFFNNIANPNKQQLNALKRWFWITTYTNYFTASLSKQRLYYSRFQDFIRDFTKFPISNDDTENLATIEFPQKIDMRSVRSKALTLFMLHYQAINYKIDKSSLYNFKSFKLFHEEENISENTVLIIREEKRITLNKYQKDLSDWMNPSLCDVDYSRFFLTEDMIKSFKENEHSRKIVLSKRKKMIVNEEINFVNNLGIKYKTKNNVIVPI